MLSYSSLKKAFDVAVPALIVISTAIFLSDVKYCYDYMEEYYDYHEDRSGDYEKLLSEQADGKELVSREEHTRRLEEAEQRMAYKGTDADLGMVGDLDGPYMKVMRESIVFLGAGKAALLQLAHPFV